MSTRQQDMPQDAMQDHLLADYLRNHPEFFNTHTRLLAELRVPHQAHGAVSLLERQITVLRDQNLELKRQLQALGQVARDNDTLNLRIQRFTLALMEARDLATTLQMMGTALREDFHADTLALCLFRPISAAAKVVVADYLPLREAAIDSADTAAFATLLATGKPLCGHLRRGQADYLYDAQADDIGSAVVLALNAAPDSDASNRLGLLGLGSRDATRYHAGLGTLFLNHLGALIGRALARPLGTTKRGRGRVAPHRRHPAQSRNRAPPLAAHAKQ